MHEEEEEIDEVEDEEVIFSPFYIYKQLLEFKTTQSNSSSKTTQSNSSRIGTILIRFGRLPQTLNQLHVGSNNGSLIS